MTHDQNSGVGIVISYGDLRAFDDRIRNIEAQGVAILAALTQLGAKMDADVQTIRNDFGLLKTFIVGVVASNAALVAARDAIDVTLNATITDLTTKYNQAVADGTAKDDAATALHNDIQTALSDAADAVAAIPQTTPAATPPTPPTLSDGSTVGGA